MTTRAIPKKPRSWFKIALGVAIVGLSWPFSAVALTCTTNDLNGNWNAAATWSGCGGGIPGPLDDVVISDFNNRTYTVTANITVRTLTFAGGTRNTTVTVNSGVRLTVNGNVVVNAPTSNNRIKLLNVAAGGLLTINGNLNLIGGGAVNRLAQLQIGNNAASDVTITGNLIVNNTTARVLFVGAGTLNLGGDFANGGTFTPATGTVVYNGGVSQSVGNYSYYRMTINKSAGNALLTGATTTVTNLLTLSQGNIVTNANALLVTANCATAVTRTSGHVVGNLRKYLPSNVSSCTFEVGDPSNYTPLTASFVAGTGDGNLTAAVSVGDHPALGTSGIDTNKSVNRYWTLTNDTAGNPVTLPAAGYSATFNYVASDVDVGANPLVFVVDRYIAPNWFPSTPGTRTATSTQASGFTDFGAFAIGERLPGYNPNLGSFNAFESTTLAGSLRGILKTRIAGGTISFDIIHINATRTAILGGATGVVTVELLNASNNAGVLDANNCRNTWATIGRSLTTSFIAADNGRKTVSFTGVNVEPNAWRDIRVRVSSGAEIGCSTDRFAIRPNALVNVNASDATWETAGTARALANGAASGGNVHKAGRPFTLRATAHNALGAVTSNYDGTPTVQSLTCNLPAGCVNGVLLFGSWSATGGTVSDANVAYSEAGSVALMLEDLSFAAVDVADSSVAERTVAQAAAVTVGRFVPDHFVVTALNTPQFKTFNSTDAACSTAAVAPKRSFTYVGQAFGYATAPQALATAKNFAGVTTSNYRGALWKVSTAAPSDITQVYANTPAKLIDTALIGSPTVTDNGDGSGTISVNTADALAFVRNATTPDAPFNAQLSLTINVSDDSEAGVNQGTITSSGGGAVFNGGGAGIAFDSGAAFRYGRLSLRNAYGSELAELVVPIEAQYWNGSGFVANSADHCTALAASDIVMDNYVRGLAACETGVSGAGVLSGGRARLRLSRPGTGNSGSVRLTANLSPTPSGQTCIAPLPTAPQAATAANRSYLQGMWSGTQYDKNPSASAHFGTHKKGAEWIYQRETY